LVAAACSRDTKMRSDFDRARLFNFSYQGFGESVAISGAHN
jgi:hypothetical protein